MITLVANTVIKLITPDMVRMRYFKIASNSTTATRIAFSPTVLESADGGFAFTSGESINIAVKPKDIVYVVSTGTPTLSISEIGNPSDYIYLR